MSRCEICGRSFSPGGSPTARDVKASEGEPSGRIAVRWSTVGAEGSPHASATATSRQAVP